MLLRAKSGGIIAFVFGVGCASMEAQATHDHAQMSEKDMAGMSDGMQMNAAGMYLMNLPLARA